MLMTNRMPLRSCSTTRRRYGLTENIINNLLELYQLFQPERHISNKIQHCHLLLHTILMSDTRQSNNIDMLFGLIFAITHLMWIAIPALFNVPQPRFIPHYNYPKNKTICVVHAAPNIFTELFQCCWLILSFTPPPPSLDLSFCQVQLFSQIHNLKRNVKYIMRIFLF